MALNPKIGDEIQLNQVGYRFTAHPSAKGMVYGQSGRRATVYQIEDSAQRSFALKVFKHAFRNPDVIRGSHQIGKFCELPGLQACQRTVISPLDYPMLIQQYLDLNYAVLMPWVQGETWQEILYNKKPLSARQSWNFACKLAEILKVMEQNGLAHTDISSPNVILDLAQDTVTLVDLEEMYGPGFEQPSRLSLGSDGYAHCEARAGLWRHDADRFAGAILLAELLAQSSQQFREAVNGESYFFPEEVQQDSPRFRLLRKIIAENWGTVLADLFECAWFSQRLDACPPLVEWSAALEAGAERFSPSSQPKPAPVPPQDLRPSAARSAQMAPILPERAAAPGTMPPQAGSPAVGASNPSAPGPRSDSRYAAAISREPITGWRNLFDMNDAPTIQTAASEHAPVVANGAVMVPLHIDVDEFHRAASTPVPGQPHISWVALGLELLMVVLVAAMALLYLGGQAAFPGGPLAMLTFGWDAALTAALVGGAQLAILKRSIPEKSRILFVLTAAGSGLLGGTAAGAVSPAVAQVGTSFLFGAAVGALFGGLASIAQNIVTWQDGTAASWFFYSFSSSIVIWGTGWTARWWIGGVGGAAAGVALILAMSALSLYLMSRLFPDLAFPHTWVPG